MRQDDDLGLLLRDLANVCEHSVNARDIGHSLIFHGNVEVCAHEHSFACDIDVIERPADVKWRRGRHISFPIATATSAIRFENPHSLSYQDMTRTKVPSMTFF